MKNLKIGARLVISIVIFMLPLSYLYYSYYASQTANIDFAAKEISGTQYLRSVAPVLDSVSRHYGHKLKADAGDTNALHAQDALEEEVNKAFADLKIATDYYVDALDLSADALVKWKRENLLFSKLEKQWQDISANPKAATTEQYDTLINDIRGLIAHTGDASNLILDPDLDSYYLMDAVVVSIPTGIARLYEAERFVNTLLLSKRSMTDEDKAKIQTYGTMLLLDDIGRTSADFQTAYTKDDDFYGVSPTLKANTEAKLAEYVKSNEEFAALLSEIVKGKDISFAEISSAVEKADSAAYSLWEASSNELNTLLEIRKADITQTRNLVLLVSFGFILLAFGVFGVVLRGIIRSLKALQDAMVEISDGKLDYPVPCTELKDEIGNMARTLQIFKETSIEAKNMEEEQRLEQNKKLERQQLVDKLINKFDGKVSGLLGEVSRAAGEMQNAADSMVSMSDKTNERSSATQKVTVETANNVSAVAAAAEELTAAINEISRQVSRATMVTHDAVTKSSEADGNVLQLTDAAHKIGEVVTMISDIAEQINLLALNATIESARAGEAGKGFAVVATEVKHLASQTSKATETISAQISEVQKVVGLVVKSLTQIRGTVDEVNNISTTIAAAVEEQGAATREIAENIQRTADRVQEVSANVVEVGNMAVSTNENARSVSGSATTFTQYSRSLQEEVESFLAEIAKA